ncbi:hypothetical protein VPH35_060632 [Triticum aestivum]
MEQHPQKTPKSSAAARRRWWPPLPRPAPPGGNSLTPPPARIISHALLAGRDAALALPPPFPEHRVYPSAPLLPIPDAEPAAALRTASSGSARPSGRGWMPAATVEVAVEESGCRVDL